MENKRIATLDGFRAIAILMVVLYHYFSRWTLPLNETNLYPYGSVLSDFPLFKFGHLGVQMFFVISGFVISMTLENSKSIGDFAIKRFARLWPAMFLCSFITYLTLEFIPVKFFSVSLQNLIPSLVFTDPELLRKITNIKDFAWMDGSYWSLFVEVRFYIWALLLFSINKPGFLSTFLIFINATLIIRGLDNVLFESANKDIVKLMFFPRFLPWFAGGIGFYYLFKDKNNRLAHFMIAESLILIISSAHHEKIMEIPFYLGIYGIFYIFIYRPNWLSFLSCKPLAEIGAASYSLYLLHQNIGVTLISYIADYGNIHTLPQAIGIGFMMIIFMIILSLLVFKFWEVPAKRFILRK